jgi:Dolichyl-phosphate-mannose-protein mannosyltransferase
LLEYVLFSDSFTQFFQGDALFYMSHRFHSWREFFHALYTLDIANWYRPLASRTIPSLFFPWFGLNPYGYHWVVFILFFAATCVVFAFLRQLTQRFVAAAAGTVFFSLHSMNVYVTYDFAFTPELFYASFYLLSCIAYLRGEQSKRWYMLSILFFVLALMSKEAAVTLPGNIVLLTFFFSTGREWKRLLPFFGIFAVYYLYIVRFLKVGAGDYVLAFHKDIFSHLQDAFLWAFNLARGRMRYAVLLAALFVISYAVASLFGSRRRFTIFGVLWFLIALSPMLGIVSYFGPYYLFLPLVGMALIAGESFDWLHRSVSQFNPKIAIALVCLGLVPFVIAARLNAQAELYTNTALGYAGRIAENSARSLKRSHPEIPRGATLFIINPDQPDLTRFFGINGLVKLLYEDDTIDVRYSSLGHTIPGDLLNSDKLVVMRYANEDLVPEDPKRLMPSQSEADFQYETSSQFHLNVAPNQVAAGKGFYTIRIAGAASTDVELQYRFNEGPLAFITIHLNPNGETRFFVSDETKRGTYRFVGMRIPPESTWFRASATITVTD